MKITVVGASGLIGTRLSERLRRSGHEVTDASLSFGVDTVTGKGLDAAIAGTDAVVDVTNAASFGDSAALDFFRASTKNLLAAASEAGVGHYLALSVVGTPRLVESDYFRAKMVQENLIRASDRPYTNSPLHPVLRVHKRIDRHRCARRRLSAASCLDEAGRSR